MTARSTPLAPALLLGAGILVATGIAVWLGETAWMVAPILLGMTILGADTLATPRDGQGRRPSAMGWFAAGVCLLAAAIIGLGDPALVVTLLPILGATGVTVVLPRRDRTTTC